MTEPDLFADNVRSCGSFYCFRSAFACMDGRPRRHVLSRTELQGRVELQGRFLNYKAASPELQGRF